MKPGTRYASHNFSLVSLRLVRVVIFEVDVLGTIYEEKEREH